jgi:hypothetical protein
MYVTGPGSTGQIAATRFAELVAAGMRFARLPAGKRLADGCFAR